MPESDARSVSSCRGPEFPIEGSERRTKKKRNASHGRLRQQPTSVATTESLTQTDQIPLIVITYNFHLDFFNVAVTMKKLMVTH